VEGINAVEELNHFLPRVGMKCRCFTDDGEIIIRSNGYQYNEHKIQFNETDESSTQGTLYLLERVGPGKIKLKLEFYRKGNLFSTALFNFTKRSALENKFKKSMNHLEGLIKELKIPTAQSN
jgi:hypothetical protein